MVIVKCQQCGKEFKTTPYIIKNGGGKYCSRKCVDNSKKKRVIKICAECGKKFETRLNYVKRGQMKYCSRKCASKNVPNYKVIIKCGFCNKEIKVIKSRVKRNKHNFCNKKCHDKYMSKYIRGDKANNWRGGISFGKYCPKFNDEFKERVRNHFGRVCPICGKHEEDCYRKLDVHHITYEKDACCNSKIAMFISLCQSCHAKTNHNREFWEDYLFNYVNIYYNGKTYIDQEDIVYYRR